MVVRAYIVFCASYCLLCRALNERDLMSAWLDLSEEIKDAEERLEDVEKADAKASSTPVLVLRSLEVLN